MNKTTFTPKCKRPDRVLSYFSMQKGIIVTITISGLIYNIGLMAGPWF